MTKSVQWSYSALNSFETCPKRYYHLRVAKDVLDEKGEAALWGDRVHKQIEARLKEGTPLPEGSEKAEPLVKVIEAQPGQKIIEYKMAINRDFNPTGWFDKDAWCRGILDAAVVNGDKAAVFDWKTGKRKVDSDQLKLFAGLTFSHYSEVKIVSTAFVWLKENKVDQDRFERKDIPEIWMTFEPRVKRLENAYETGSFPAKPSGLCRRHCPVPKSKCPHSGKLG